MEARIVRRFLESVGAKADIDLYLKLHRAQRKESFAMLAPNAQIVKSALDPLHFDLRILAGLGLLPVVVLGLLEPKDAGAQAARVSEWLLEDDVPCEIVGATAIRGRDRRRRPSPRSAAIVARGAIPLVSLEARRRSRPRRASACSRRWPRALETRKLVFFSRRPGLAPNGGPNMPVVSLAIDTQRLLAPGALPRGQAMLLRQVKRVIESVPQRLSVTVVNPLQLLRELFTVNGAGTLIARLAHRRPHQLGGHRPGAHRGAVRVGVRAPGARRLLRAAAGAHLRRGELLGRGGRAGDPRRRRTSPSSPSSGRRRAKASAASCGRCWRATSPASSGGRARQSHRLLVRQAVRRLRAQPEWHVFWRGMSPR